MFVLLDCGAAGLLLSCGAADLWSYGVVGLLWSCGAGLQRRWEDSSKMAFKKPTLRIAEKKKYSTVRKGTVPYGTVHNSTVRYRTLERIEPCTVPLVFQAKHLCFQGLRLFIPLHRKFKRMHV